MKTKPLTLLLSFCFSSALFAASPALYLPAWLQSSNAEAGSIEAFRAFHSAADLTHVSANKVLTPMSSGAAVYPDEFRTLDGEGNNASNLGAANSVHVRLTSVGYGDGVGTPAGADRLGARDISNKVAGQTGLIQNSTNLSGFFWEWGQFVDHDMGLNSVANPAEPFDIPVPKGDPQFDPRNTGTRTLPFQRSSFTLVSGIRQQVNVNTAFIDASTVYSSGNTTGHDLRTFDGTGGLRTSDNNLLPFNINGFPNQPDTSATFFIAGDVRANENAALTALHTIFMREHNFWAASIKASDGTLKDSDIYFRARAIVGAEIQLITYRDFLPLLLGPNALTPYTGYNPAVDPGISSEFAVAAFRFGHSMLPPTLMRLNASNQSIGDSQLGQTFFNPSATTARGVEPFLRGLAKQIPQQVDPFIDDAVRSFLIGGKPGRGGFDLAALNIQRGRDHGIPSYNRVRTDLGLPAKATFADVTPDTALQAKLASAYTSPDDMDFWVGGLAEPHMAGAQVGETFWTIIKDQFQRARDGDRFWYESYLDPTTLATVQAQTLSLIIKRNSPISREMQDNVFLVP